MTIKKLKGVITHDTGDAADRAGLLCQCQLCGITAHCKPQFDFYSCAPGQPLACENCVMKKGLKAPYVQLSRDDHLRITVENTRAACAQIADLIRGRELGRHQRGVIGNAHATAEEIRNRILDRQQFDLDLLPTPGAPASGNLFD